MDQKPHTDGDMETVEESPHTFRESQALRNQRRAGMDVGKHKKRLLAYCP